MPFITRCKQAPICPEAAAVPVRASFSLAVSRASVVALARAAFQQAAECAAVQLAAAEVRVSVPPLADDSVPDDCSAAPLADDSVAPDSSCSGAHWVRAGCPDDSPA